jgi:predicted permease
MRQGEWLLSVLQDVRYGLRQFRTAPGLALAVVLSLAIGVGANTAIFSLIEAAILRPLPVNDPDSLRIVEWTNDKFPDAARNINGDFNRLSTGRVQASSISANLYRALARQQAAFESLVGIADANSVALSIDGAPAEQVSLQHVSSNFFQALGVVPPVGRPFRAEEDAVAHEPVVIVSHRFWLRAFAGSRDALDRPIRINSAPARIVGVAPTGFFGLRAGQWTDVYAPLASRVAFQPGASDGGGALRGEDDRDWWVRQVARLKRGVPEAAATREIARQFRNLGAVPELVTLPGRRGFNSLNPRDTNALWILMLLVGVLLVIVCANVANLLLARSVARQRESAVRLALGAGGLRLLRQHMVESGTFALLGGAAGLVLGYALALAIHEVFQTGRDASGAFDVTIDLRVLGYTGALSIVTTLVFGLAPAIRSARSDLSGALTTQTRSVMTGRLRVPRLLVSVQIALCLAALVAAGLLGRSLNRLKVMDVGFDRENLAYASVNPVQAGYSLERIGPYVDRLRGEIRRIPGVLSVSATQIRLLSGQGNLSRISIPGRVSQVERGIVNNADAAFRNSVSDDFFETMKVPLAAGRFFVASDVRSDASPVIVDERFAQHFFPDQNPIARRFGFDANDNTRYEIVGVVRDTRYNSLRNEPRPTVYEPYPGSLGRGRGPVHLAIRTTIDSTRLAPAVRRAVAGIDPTVPLTEFHTQTGLIDRLLRTERLLGFMSGAFGLIALTLSAIGLGGLLSYAVARRRAEIGVRMALGADAGDVVRMVLRDSLQMVGVGILIGLPCAYATGRTLKSVLFEVEPLDAWTSALSFSVLLGIALLAAWVPARQAANIDPITALRAE